MEEARRAFVPAAGHDWGLPLYDPFVRFMGGDRAHGLLVERAGLRPGGRVLDVGCGTGSLAVRIARLHPSVDVVGLDPDPKALARARRKALSASVAVRLDRGYADALPHPDASFDRVLSSFMFHHLRGEEKAAMLREARRVLKPGAALLLLDFTRLLGSARPLADNAEERVVARLRQAGFADARRVGGGAMALGVAAYSCYEAIARRAE